MAISIWEISITDEPLESPEAHGNPDSGAILDFWGTVRRLENDREITGIDYEVHRPMAEHQMNSIAEKARADFFLTGLMLHHRVGFVPAGEASLFLRVISRHRGAAFAASQWLIQELKTKVPIWKRPVWKESPAEKQIEEVVNR
jgi:molybdopterin synthase catalytic subunit